MSKPRGRRQRRFIRNDGKFDAESLFGLSPNEQAIYNWWWYLYIRNYGMQASVVSLRQATGKLIGIPEINHIMKKLRDKKMICDKRSGWGMGFNIYISIQKKRKKKAGKIKKNVVPGYMDQIGMFKEK